MASPIRFEFITDLRRFLPGMRQVHDGMDQVATDLKHAADESDTLERNLKQSFDAVQREARTTGDTLDRELDLDSSGSAREGAAEIGSELAENLSEGFQSGDFAGVATETAASLTQGLAGLGPLGAGVGVGAGAMALIVSQMRAKAEQIEALGKEMGDSLASALADGISDVEIRETITDSLKTALEDSGTSMGEFGRIAEEAGVSMDEIITGIATGDTQFTALRDRLEDVAGRTRTYTGANGQAITVQTEQAKRARALLDVMDRMTPAMRVAGDNAIYEADARDGAAKSAAQYRRELDRARASLRGATEGTKDFRAQLDALPRSVQVNVKTNIADAIAEASDIIDKVLDPFQWSGGRRRSHMSDGRRAS